MQVVIVAHKNEQQSNDVKKKDIKKRAHRKQQKKLFSGW